MTKEKMVLCQDDEMEIAKLLLGRRIISVTDDELALDNGTVISVEPNEGCGGCASGNFGIELLERCDNVITSVRVAVEDLEENMNTYTDTAYRIYVLAEGHEFPILSVAGTDGNGYYGTGYRLYVTVPR